MCRGALHYAFRLYTQLSRDRLVGCRCSCDTFERPELGNIKGGLRLGYVDAAATFRNRKVALSLVNRHISEPAVVEVRVNGDKGSKLVRPYVMEADRFDATPDFGRPDEIRLVRLPAFETDPPFEVTVPPHSVAFYVIGPP